MGYARSAAVFYIECLALHPAYGLTIVGWVQRESL